MKKFYVIALLLALFTIGASAQKIQIGNTTKATLPVKVGDTFKKDYVITGFHKAAPKKGVKTFDEDSWEPYDCGKGTYTRLEDTGLTDVESFEAYINYQEWDEDTLVFQIPNFLAVYSGENDSVGNPIYLYSDLMFKVDTVSGQIIIPAQDLGIYITATNTKTGERVDVECFVADVVCGGLFDEYYDYGGSANLAFGSFEYCPYYFCAAGGFGFAKENFALEGKVVWEEEKLYAIADWAHPLFYETDPETGEVIDNGIQTDILVYAQTYAPQPSIKKLRFAEWGAGYWTKGGVDFYVTLDEADTTSVTIEAQETGDTYYDEEEEVDYGSIYYISPLSQINPDVWPLAKCYNRYDPETRIADVYPAYFWYVDASEGSISGYFSCSTDGACTRLGWYDQFQLKDIPEAIENTKIENTSVKSAIYNLSGVRVSNDYKGIVIMNGKKVLNK